VLKMSIKKY